MSPPCIHVVDRIILVLCPLHYIGAITTGEITDLVELVVLLIGGCVDLGRCIVEGVYINLKHIIDAVRDCCKGQTGLTSEEVEEQEAKSHTEDGAKQ